MQPVSTSANASISSISPNSSGRSKYELLGDLREQFLSGMIAISEAEKSILSRNELATLRELLASEYFAGIINEAGKTISLAEMFRDAPQYSCPGRARSDWANRIIEWIFRLNFGQRDSVIQHPDTDRPKTTIDPNTIATPLVFFASSHGALKRHCRDKEYDLIRSLYHDNGNLIFTIDGSPTTALRTSEAKLYEVAAILTRLSKGGQTLTDCPVVPGSIGFKRNGNILEAECLLSSYGFIATEQIPLIKKLVGLQSLTEGTPVHRVVVTLEGPLSAADLNTLYTEDPLHPPTPAVQLRYRIPLPSGATGNILLRADTNPDAFNYSQHDNLSGSDAQILSGLVRLVRSPSKRQLIDTIKLDHSVSLTGTDSEATALSMSKLRGSWAEQLWELCRTENATTNLVVRSGVENISSSLIEDLNLLSEEVRNVTVRLPELFPHRPRQQLECTPTSLDSFVQECVPRIQVLVKQMIDEAGNVDSIKAEERAKKNYRGPLAGYGLDLPVIVLDHLVDYKKVSHLRSIYGREHNVPESKRRNLSSDRQFYSVKDLAELVKKLKLNREILAVVHDPKHPKGVYHLTGRAAGRAGLTVAEENFRRATNIIKLSSLKEFNQRFLGRSTWADFNSVHIGQSAAEILLDKINRCRKVLEMHQRRLAELATEVNTRSNSDRELRKQSVHSAKRPLQIQIEEDEINLIRYLKAYVVLASLISPNEVEGWRAKLITIQDRNSINFIYGIDASGNPVFELEGSGPDGFTRVTHSQLLKGKRAFGAGGVIIGTHDEVFLEYADWVRFDRQLRMQPPKRLHCLEVNNGSGHYKPDAYCSLLYSCLEMFPRFEAFGIDTSRCMMRDLLAPGAQLRSI